jgi:4-diphosphocytidyl-2-C-methyl-D-erythritol kinase
VRGIDAPKGRQQAERRLGSDVPACLLSMSARGAGTGDMLELIDDARIAGTPVLLINPLVPLSTREVFGRWDGLDRGPLGDWHEGRNDLEAAAISLVPQIGAVLDWLRQQEGASFVRMSGSGASCFAFFESDEARDAAADAVPEQWWRLPTKLR